LSKPERARFFEALEQIERHGFDAVRAQFGQIEGKLWKIGVSAHRVFYVLIEREEMVLLHAYKKQGQKLPFKEREVAVKRMKEFAVMKAKNKRVALKDVLKGELKDSQFSFYFEREKSISDIARLVRDARLKAGLTQAQLAKRAQSSQVVIARLESGTDQRVPSLDLLERIASALKAKLLVRFEYKKVA
jgi:ribosome-binding protein aMBF1 (putative translation factor)